VSGRRRWCESIHRRNASAAACGASAPDRRGDCSPSSECRGGHHRATADGGWGHL